MYLGVDEAKAMEAFDYIDEVVVIDSTICAELAGIGDLFMVLQVT